MEGILISDNVAYLPKSQTAVLMEAPTARVGKTVAAPDRPAVPASSPAFYEVVSATDIAYWGENNTFPQDIIAAASKSTSIPALLDWKARAAQGALVLPYERFYDESAEEWRERPIKDLDIVAFFLNENTKRYYREAYNDFYWFWNVFPDLIKNDTGDKIAYIGTHEASWCRWYKQNSKGVVDKVAVASTWANGIFDAKGPNALVLPVVDPTNWNLIESLKADTEKKRFVYPTSYPSPDKSYYQLAPWDGYRVSGWMALAEKIPVFKEALMKHQVKITKKISIPNNYWPSVYPDWDQLTQEQKAQKKKAKLEEVDAKLAGAENAGKSILVEVGVDVNGEKLPGWDIEVIDDKLKDGAYIEDSQEAFAHLLSAMSLDGTLVGQGPGRDLNAGGGSDKLIAFNMYCALLGPQRQVVDEPVYFACRYNGYFDRYPFMFIKTIEAAPKALDVSKKVSNQVQDQNGG